jgi:hypothetical protein
MKSSDRHRQVVADYGYKGYRIIDYASMRASPERRYRVTLRGEYGGAAYSPNKVFEYEADARYYAEMYAETH